MPASSIQDRYSKTVPSPAPTFNSGVTPPIGRSGVTPPMTPSQNASNKMFADSKAALDNHANAAFDTWYRDQHPDVLDQFAPKAPINGSFRGSANGVTTTHINSEAEDAAVKESMTRSAARQHFIATELPKDPQHQALQTRHDAAITYRMTGQLPQPPAPLDPRVQAAQINATSRENVAQTSAAARGNAAQITANSRPGAMTTLGTHLIDAAGRVIAAGATAAGRVTSSLIGAGKPAKPPAQAKPYAGIFPSVNHEKAFKMAESDYQKERSARVAAFKPTTDLTAPDPTNPKTWGKYGTMLPATTTQPAATTQLGENVPRGTMPATNAPGQNPPSGTHTQGAATQPASGTAAQKPIYKATATGVDGSKIGFNEKTKQWEPIQQ